MGIYKADWERIHHEKTVVDLHNHSSLKAFLFGRDLTKKKFKFLSTLFKGKFWPFSARNNFDMMKKGGLDVMLSTAYATEQGWVDDISLIKWLLYLTPSVRRKAFKPSYFDITMSMLDEIETQTDKYNGKNLPENHIKMAYSVTELESCLNNKIPCIVHAVEGAHSLHGPISGKKVEDCKSDPKEVEKEMLANLEHFYNRGVAYLGIAHFYPNHCAYPVFPYPDYGLKHLDWQEALGRWDATKGLTDIGIRVVEKMLDLGMVIDVCHCTPRARSQIYEIVESSGRKNCVMSTHTGVYAVNPDPYNLEDWEIKWIADNGGAIGMIFMNYWLSPTDTKMGLKYLSQTLEHLVNVGGIDVPAVGTDFDGFTDPPEEIINMSQLPRFTKFMMAEYKGVGVPKYSESDMEKILGGNALRVLLNGWRKE